MTRADFRERCVERDGGQCLVPWCDEPVTTDVGGPGEVHHIIERELWDDGGYVVNNGASVCNEHHQMAEQNEIPPQAFWRWADIRYSPTPDGIETAAIDKWGEGFETPPHSGLREYPKYPSTRHLLPLYWQSERGTAEERTERDDTGLTSVESFLDIPLVVTIKLDGSNAMLVKDADVPVRPRSGKEPSHPSFDQLQAEYWNRNVYEALPEHLQVFGENMYAKHSIHYGCPTDGCGGCEDRGPALDDVFYVFGVYDTRYDLWLSWPETEEIVEQIGFPTPPANYYGPWEEREFLQQGTNLGEHFVGEGHEGIIVRSKYPFHYGQFERKLGKFVRPNHVKTDEHWSHRAIVRNEVSL